MSFSNRRLVSKVAAEMVGTFALVFVGCGAIVVDAMTQGAITHLGVGLIFGLVVMVMVYATGHISGAHFNPAVTLAFACLGRFSWREVPAYLLGQITAAVFAALMLMVLLDPVGGLGATTPSATVHQALGMEFVLSFFLMFVITSVATDGRAVGQMAGLAIGSTVAMAALFGGPVSGASMNPARTLGPGWVSGEWSAIWVYLVGPIAGAVAGAWTYQLIRCEEEGSAENAGGCC